MRTNAATFFERWADPTFQEIGVQRTRGFVTCEPDWWLTATSSNVGAWPKEKRPIRWWQRADNSQTEIEIPQVKNIGMDKSIESDAAECTVTLSNQWMKTNFASQIARRLGIPGYFTFDHGVSSEAQDRWQHETNEWQGRLVPGALLRTYEGHGGFNPDGTSKTRQEMIDDGDIILTGVWQVDDVTIGAVSKLIELKCRNMMALLIDQIIYPPYVPDGLYPLQYQRWVDTTYSINYQPKHPSPPVLTLGGALPASYETSEVDAWYGPNTVLHGHTGRDSVDGNFNTYWLGVGNSGPDKPWSTDYIQYRTGGQQVGGISVTCCRGGYTMYVSVMENGRWIGSDRVPYDWAALEAGQPGSVNTYANIPYMMKIGSMPADKAYTVKFPRPIRADRIRISFRHLVNFGIGQWLYRGAVREFKALGVKSTTSSNTRPYGWGALERHSIDGYWTLSYEGKVHAFGHAVHYGDRYGKDSRVYVDICATPDDGGYWLLDSTGDVWAFGNAVHYGNYAGTTTNGMALCRTYTGAGYWILFRGGTIDEHGDAPSYANISLATGAVVVDGAAMTDAYGLWVMDDDGNIHERGSAPDYGEVNDFSDFALNHAQGISVNPDGNGFIVTGFAGWVSGYGTTPGGSTTAYGVARIGAVSAGYRPSEGVRIESIAINGDNTGYWALSTDGEIYTRGSANRWGSPEDGAGTIRRDGNYKDYTDIVKDLLLWGGWFYYETLGLSEQPAVFGNLESTGIYAPDPLPPDMFDKKHPIDPIKQLREIVGYITWVDDEGGFRFESPNWWSAGNFLDDGTHTSFIPEVDERINLIDYTARFTKSKDRSKIIISTDEPTAGFDDTITTEFVPPNSLLRGQVIPAMIRVPMNVTKEEQELMAELIALHLWFARRQGSVQIKPACPGLSINDQVRIIEQVTSETYIHYIRAISSNHDLETGEWNMTLTTNWLGTNDADWAITAEDVPLPVGGEQDITGRYPISDRLTQWLQEQRKSLITQEQVLTLTPDLDAPDPGTGSANG